MDATITDPLLGQLLDRRYRIDERLARGGMGTVYTGFDTRLDRSVAIKVMHSALADDDAFVERFRREAKHAARLSHPNVVSIFDQGEDDGRVYLVMELVPGGTLRARLQEGGRLSPAEALTVLEPVLEALAAAHDAGMVHRDVKPENVLLPPHGRVKVADFGLARALQATSHTLAQGVLIGTVAYLAPEQVSGGAADERTDVYSAGILLYEMLTGQVPFRAETPLAIAYQRLTDDVPAPSTSVPGLSPALDEIVSRATAREPAERWPDAREMLAGVRRARATLPAGTDTIVVSLDDAPTLLTQFATGAATTGAAPTSGAADNGAGAVAPGPRRRERDQRRRRRRLVGAAATVLVLLVAAVAGWWLGTGGPTPTPTPAAAASVTTPTLTGLTFRDAAARAAAQGLQVRRDDVFSATAPAGRVVAQDPRSGAVLPSGGTVTLRVSRGPELVRVPDVRGKTLRDAGRALTAAGLKVGRTGERFDERVHAGQVVEMSLNPRTAKPPRGTAVDLVVSKGPAPVKVPDVRGQPVEPARARLTAAGLDPTVRLVFSDDVAKDVVISQEPASGSVPRGTTVRLTVSKGPDVVTVPNVTGLSRDKAAGVLQQAGLRASFIDFPGRRGRIVADQDPREGARLRRGSSVTCFLI